MPLTISIMLRANAFRERIAAEVVDGEESGGVRGLLVELGRGEAVPVFGMDRGARQGVIPAGRPLRRSVVHAEPFPGEHIVVRVDRLVFIVTAVSEGPSPSPPRARRPPRGEGELVRRVRMGLVRDVFRNVVRNVVERERGGLSHAAHQSLQGVLLLLQLLLQRDDLYQSWVASAFVQKVLFRGINKLSSTLSLQDSIF